MTRTVRLVALLALLLLPTAAAEAAEHRLGIGQLYWRSIEDVADAGVEDDGTATFLTYQYVPAGIFRLEVDLEYYPKGFGGAESEAYAPVGMVLVEFGLYAGVGAGITLADDFGSNASEPFYVARVGWDFQLIPRLHLDVNANYRSNTFSELREYDSDSITLGAAARLAF